MRKRIFIASRDAIFVLIALLLLAPLAVQAAAPGLINFQGR
ncbi:MAG: hypothetical protein V2I40_03960 [Desulfobacteraceae bacterium]|jgi:hypothetical protein|nr:hypothetical protein [Desulfobacteraceae bacterium]